MKKIYLAIPYNDPDDSLRHFRFRKANEVAAELMNQGHCVFSPISHSHPIAEQCDLPKGYDFWHSWNKPFVEWCDELHVVAIPGWGDSSGVQDEIRMAREMGKEVVFI